MFIGRDRELGVLSALLRQVADGVGEDRPGRCLLIRGRRRIGKSMLAEEFIQRSGLPALFFSAADGQPSDHLGRLREDIAASSLPDSEVYTEHPPASWSGALDALADALPLDEPSIVVLDEVPYLMRDVPGFEGYLQRAWDRFLSRHPVLLLLIGSDLAMMEALNDYERPFHQRGTEMVVGPLTPADIGDMAGLEPADAFDAALVTGGLPLLCGEWPRGGTVWDYLGGALDSPVSALQVSAERSLSSEFPPAAQARKVLTAIGNGERTFTNIQRSGEHIALSSLNAALKTLESKRLVNAELPLSLKASKDRRYSIADPYLRFWLSFIGPNMTELERQRPDLVLDRIKASWSAWRGRAVEPLVREALWRLLPDERIDVAPGAVGAYWTRTNDVEIDVVVADRGPIAKEVRAIGSIKWRDEAPFDVRDLTRLENQRSALTDGPLPLIAVSRSGVTAKRVDGAYGPEDLLAAWRS
ncbi:ATP-binding protein [Glycomyces sp. MUSA5-2]|uniref:ATP-binding protein n=1 Tax=Glycomyces sp. MUSA5-2 TaxID=2053002 RepID=UPI003008DFA7